MEPAVGGMLFLLVSLSVASAAVLAGGWEYPVCGGVGR